MVRYLTSVLGEKQCISWAQKVKSDDTRQCLLKLVAGFSRGVGLSSELDVEASVECNINDVTYQPHPWEPGRTEGVQGPTEWKEGKLRRVVEGGRLACMGHG